jgi:hypothetical protein
LVALAGCGAPRPPLVPSDDVVHACMTASLCGIATAGFVDCVSDLADVRDPPTLVAEGLIAPSEVPCLAAAGTDCDRARACMNLGMPAAVCTAPTASCDGDVVHGCGGGTTPLHQTAFDCASVGLRCLTDSLGNPACVAGACSSGEDACVGDTHVDCNNGVLQVTADCIFFDGHCTTDAATGKHRCGGDGAACSSTERRCDGDVVVACDGSHEARVDCAALGLRCVGSGQSVECANDTRCHVDTAMTTCDAGRITYCFAGTWLTADCVAAGFSGCGPAGCAP